MSNFCQGADGNIFNATYTRKADTRQRGGLVGENRGAAVRRRAILATPLVVFIHLLAF
jgi:hypothetical protein